MKMTVVPIFIGSIGTVLKSLGKNLEKMEIRRRQELGAPEMIALQKTVIILRRVLE